MYVWATKVSSEQEVLLSSVEGQSGCLAAGTEGGLTEDGDSSQSSGQTKACPR